MGRNVIRKILEAHLVEGRMVPGEEIGIKVDQVLIQDITGTAVMLHFEAMGLPRVRCKAAAYGDHNVLQFDARNTEDHLYLETACRKYGITWGKPGVGIGHQVHQEHFGIPGETCLGADSHTVHGGGIGMYAMGAGGLDVAVAMGGGAYYFDMPYVVGVRLTGALRPWSSAKDVILELLRRLTVRGGYGKALEYLGPGLATLNLQQRSTIANMATELGTTTSIFPSDAITRDYFERIGRAHEWRELVPDPDAAYDDIIEVDLSAIEPLVSLPSMPDRVVPVHEAVGTPVEQVMVGSCTNGAYTDLMTVAQVIRGQRVHPRVNFVVLPSSRLDLELASRNGAAAEMIAAGINLNPATCGACIGVGNVPAAGTRSLRAFNRNFKGRSGQKDDLVYLCSPEVAAVSAIYGEITDPRTTSLTPPASLLPEAVPQANPGLVTPAPEGAAVEVYRGENIRPVPVKAPPEDRLEGEVLIKVGDDITTDHIMPAGAQILAFRSNIPKLAEFVFNRVDPEFVARAREHGGGFIVAGENYGQGSSREHAAIAPMFLGVRGVIAKSFARIHLANLINWGIVPMVFDNWANYDTIEQGDVLLILGALTHIAESDRFAVRNVTRNHEFMVRVDLTRRERELLRWGGRLAYTKANPIT